MKKISYYLALIVVLGVGVVSFWIYQKYFKVEQKPIIAFQVVRGDIHEAVSVRGEVVSEKEFNFEFPFGGTIERIYVKEGQNVKAGDPLVKLETSELEIERTRLASVVAQSEAALKNLLIGAKEEDLSVSEARVASARVALADAEKTLLDASLSAYTQADDAVHNVADKFFSNARTVTPILNLVVYDAQQKTDLEKERASMELILSRWKANLPVDTVAIVERSATVKTDLGSVKTFLQNLAMVVNGLAVSDSVSQATLDAWKLSVSTSRAAIDTAVAAVTVAEEKVSAANAAYSLSLRELELKQSKPRSTDVVIAEAQVTQNKSALALIDEKIRKSTLRAPGDGVVKKVVLKEKEIFNPGMIALVFASSAYRVQADVSELDISKVRYTNGSEASVRLDAFPAVILKGKVVFIDPKEVVKNEDIYFRTNIFLDKQDGAIEIRSGMSADVVLYGVLKKNVLTVPELSIEKRGGVSYVKVAPGAKTKDEVNSADLVERQVTTGVSDGESVEILTGLTEGEVVVVSS